MPLFCLERNLPAFIPKLLLKKGEFTYACQKSTKFLSDLRGSRQRIMLEQKAVPPKLLSF